MATKTKTQVGAETSPASTPSTGNRGARISRSSGSAPQTERRTAPKTARAPSRFASSARQRSPVSQPTPPHVPAQPIARDPAPPAVPTTEPLTLRVSASLLRQLETRAQAEGVSPSTLATELLAEGLVLRAWDVLARPDVRYPASGQRTTSTNTGNWGRGQRQGRQDDRGQGRQDDRGQGRQDDRGQGRQGDRGNRRRPQRPDNRVMDDQATFMEYVRQQERKRR